MKTLSIMGRLGRDAELKFTKGGDSVLNASVAVEDRKKVNGEWTSETLWVGVTMFGKRGEGLAKHLVKGARVTASGELNVRTYEVRDGQTRTTIELIARDIWPIFEKREGGSPGAGREYKSERNGGAPGPGYEQEPGFGGDDDSIPF